MDANYHKLADLLAQRQSLSDGDIEKIAQRLAESNPLPIKSISAAAKDDSPSAVLKKLSGLGLG